MKKRTKMPTRKRKALRRIFALVLVIIFASVARIYNFLPVQAARSMADMKDVEHPKVVERFYDGTLPVTRFALYHLVDGDSAMMLCATGWNVFMGWYDRTSVGIETWRDTGVHAGLYSHFQDELVVHYLFGRIDDADIRSLSLEFRTNPQPEEAILYSGIEIPEEDIFEKNGVRYFLSKLEAAPGEEWPDFLYEAYLTGYGEEGSDVERVEVYTQSWHS